MDGSSRHPFIDQLLDLGIEVSLAQAACEATSFSSVDSAMAFLFDNNQNQEENCEGSSGDQRYKLTIVVRGDLKMSPGKIAAQTCHAALEGYRKVSAESPRIIRSWKAQGEPIIVLKIQNMERLKCIANSAIENGLPTSMIIDAGRTEVAAGSATCCAIGPDLVEKIDLITRTLELLK